MHINFASKIAVVKIYLLTSFVIDKLQDQKPVIVVTLLNSPLPQHYTPYTNYLTKASETIYNINRIHVKLNRHLVQCPSRWQFI